MGARPKIPLVAVATLTVFFSACLLLSACSRVHTAAPGGPEPVTTNVAPATTTSYSAATSGGPPTTTTTSTSKSTTTSTTGSVTTSPTVAALPAILPAGAPTLHVPILMYHFVDLFPLRYDRWSPGLTVTTAEFEAQMNYLARAGFHAVTLEDIYAAMGGGPPLPSKPVGITFDDGNRDNFTEAYPILRTYGFVATFFVVTGFIGGEHSMTWDDLVTMHDAGMAIESHTVSHVNLRQLDARALQQQLVGSREALFAHLGSFPSVLAYPFGQYDKRVIDAAQQAGYLAAVTTQFGGILGPGSRYSWPRIRVDSGETLDRFIADLA